MTYYLSMKIDNGYHYVFPLHITTDDSLISLEKKLCKIVNVNLCDLTKYKINKPKMFKCDDYEQIAIYKFPTIECYEKFLKCYINGGVLDKKSQFFYINKLNNITKFSNLNSFLNGFEPYCEVCRGEDDLDIDCSCRGLYIENNNNVEYE